MQFSFSRGTLTNNVALFLCVVFAVMAMGANELSAQVVESDPDTHDITKPLVLNRLSGPLKLDGVVDEAAWAAIMPVPLIQYQPVYGGEMSQVTEIRVAYDDEYLWVSAKFFESDVSNIRANTLTRDLSSSDDILAIVLDTFKDNENALWFSTTPLGTRIDRAVSGDAEFVGGGFESVMNSSWNTYWDAVSTVTDEGWFSVEQYRSKCTPLHGVCGRRLHADVRHRRTYGLLR